MFDVGQQLLAVPGLLPDMLESVRWLTDLATVCILQAATADREVIPNPGSSFLGRPSTDGRGDDAVGTPNMSVQLRLLRSSARDDPFAARGSSSRSLRAIAALLLRASCRARG